MKMGSTPPNKYLGHVEPSPKNIRDFSVLVNPNTMPKIQSRRARPHKSQPFETMALDEKSNDQLEDHIENEPNEELGESNHSVHKRHAAEWKRMKSQVSQIKKQRKALSKKQRDRKKQLSQEIKHLISSLRTRHEEELISLGIVPPKRSDIMEDDMEEE
jgi:hypothetical protein